jgi:ring-1,2-phenylacetyl-CoA epoxidase subunit PaaD
MTHTDDITRIKSILGKVTDPEVPVLTIEDLGILRSIDEVDGRYVVTITPTYSGCPAMRTVEDNIREILAENGIENFKIRTVLAPAWTTDWMSEDGKRKLKEYGIAPPEQSTEEHLLALVSGMKKPVTCPFCNSKNTRLTSAFGSTACKAFHYCDQCHQPFEEFKCH